MIENKDLTPEELEPEVVTLTDEDGVEREFCIIGNLELDGNIYLAMVDADSDDNAAECEYVILKVVEENGEEVLVTIDDDDEFDRVADAFDNEFMEEIDLDTPAKQ